MASMKFNACLDMSCHGLLHLSIDAGEFLDTVTRHPQCNGEVLLHCQQELCMQGFLGVPTDKNPEDSNLASV
jgi:hypothetical protein